MYIFAKKDENLSCLVEKLFSTHRGEFHGQTCALIPTDGMEQWQKQAWKASWHHFTGEDRAVFLNTLPEWFGFSTSGHTHVPRQWFRSKAQVLAEIDLLVTLCQAKHADSIITFAPVNHFYGFLCSFFLPLTLGLPVWYQPVAAPQVYPKAVYKSPMFITIPSALTYLERQERTLNLFESFTIVYSTALLPPSARRLVKKTHGKVYFVELFGSTETGLIATRRLLEGDEQEWQLANDVHLKTTQPSAESELEICSPRLAYPETGPQPRSWKTGDYAEILSPRSFRFYGRRSRLLKINGQRVNLEDVENSLRQSIVCKDVACVSYKEEHRGEFYDLLVVPEAEHPLSSEEIFRHCASILRRWELPRKVVITAEIKRSSVGKLSHEYAVKE